MAESGKLIAFQGELGANSHEACLRVFPDSGVLPCSTFEDAFDAVKSGKAELGMIPIENSLAGRVADIHHLLPSAGLYIVGEYFLKINHKLMGVKGTDLSDLKEVHSHIHALGQCKQTLRTLGLKAVTAGDTAGSARFVAEKGDKRIGAVANPLAAEIYGLDILKEDVDDAEHNTTRFVVLSHEPDDAEPEEENVVTSFVFQVRNVPAALYKCMGGFATNGVNMTKLESYQLDGSFSATQFYADIEGHPENRNVRLALEELNFFCTKLEILGVYKAADYRLKAPTGGL